MENKEIQSQTSGNLLDELTEQRDLGNVMAALSICMVGVHTELRLCECCPYHDQGDSCLQRLLFSSLEIARKYYDVKFP